MIASPDMLLTLYKVRLIRSDCDIHLKLNAKMCSAICGYSVRIECD